jgi:hypothetical protein
MIVMIFIMVMGVSLASLASLGTHERRQAARLRTYQDELAAAEQVVDQVIGQIKFFAANKPRQVGGAISNFHNAVLGIQIPSKIETVDNLNHSYTFTIDRNKSGITCVAGNNLQYETITDPKDEWVGYAALRIDYRIRVFVKSDSSSSQRLSHPGVALERTIRVEQKPLYAYAIFYGNTLELDAGVRLDVIGRVHTNGNFFLTTSSSAYYHKQVTVAGDFVGGYYDPTTGRGISGSNQIYIGKDGTSTPSNTGGMQPLYGRADSSSKYLTSKDVTGWAPNPIAYKDYTGWVNESSTRFNGYLKDSHTGINAIGLPVSAAENPHLLIEPPSASDSDAAKDAKFAYKADVKIYGDPRTASSIYATNGAGVTIPLTYTDSRGVTQSVVSTSTIYNGREGKYVDIINIDMGKLIASGIDVGSGIIYVDPTQPTGSTATTRESAVRLTNAATVPTNVQGALTVATSAPMYTQGNINTDQSAILLLAADAINTLSSAFADSKYTNSTQAASPQTAVATITNAIFLTGNVPSAKLPGRYSGGAENFFRYLEKWGTTASHTFNGSLLNLFESQIAIGPWDQSATPGTQSSPYYAAPRRIWSWDPNLAGVVPPPGMPYSLECNLLEWKLIDPDSAS